MARVILVYPSTGLDVEGVSVWLPLSVLSVASTLAEENDVTIIDQRLSPDWRSDLEGLLSGGADLVGISSMTGRQILGGLEAAHLVREFSPGTPVVWGGIHPTLLPEDTIRDDAVDIVIPGDGEETTRDLVRALADGDDPSTVPGLLLSGDGGVIRTPSRPPIADLDPLPPLPYDLIEIERYITGGILGAGKRGLPLITSRGCPYECAFCCQPVLSGGRWRRMSVDRVLEEAFGLVDRFSLDGIEFHDEEFFVDRKRAMDIAAGIGGRFEWYCQTRMDDLLAVDLDELAASGLRHVQPGIETGSPRILEMIRKRETVETFIEANRRLAETPIIPTYNFMMGFPGETREDLDRTVDLALRLLDENPRARLAGFYVYVPYPGAALFERAVSDGFPLPENLEAWASLSRHHLSSPWLEGSRDEIGNLLFTSKLLDGKRIIEAFGPGMKSAAASLFSGIFRRRWRRHDYSPRLDTRILSAWARRYYGW